MATTRTDFRPHGQCGNFTCFIRMLGLLMLAMTTSFPLKASADNTLLGTGGYYYSSYVSMALPCNTVTVELDGSGTGMISLADALGSTPTNPSDYFLELRNQGHNRVNCSHAGKKYVYYLRHQVTREECYGWVYVKDVIAPSIDCSGPLTLYCLDDLEAVAKPVVYDNCTPESALTITYTDDRVINKNCAELSRAITVTRTWKVADQWGNSNICTQTIYISRPNITNVVIPADVAYDCPAVNTNPAYTGVPTIDSKPFDQLCGILVDYKDQIKKTCGNSYILWRTWKLTDQCTWLVIERAQTIQIIDNRPPVVDAVPDVTISTDRGSVFGTYMLMAPRRVEDACHGSNVTITAIVNNMHLIDLGQKISLRKGDHIVRYTVTDPCGNVAYDTTRVHVVDKDPPIINCADITVTLPTERIVEYCLEDFTNIEATDNCGPFTLMIKRDNDLCGLSSTDDLRYDSCVQFCCEDARIVWVTVKATDLAGNTSTCRFRVTVLGGESTRPDIVVTPAEKTISCNQPVVFDQPTVMNVCGPDLRINRDTIQNTLGVCGLGMITVRYIAINTRDNTRDTATQKITVVNSKPFTAANVICPVNDTIQGCTAADATNLEPIKFTGLDSLSCYDVDTVFTQKDSSSSQFCVILVRTWVVTEKCSGARVTCRQLIFIQDNTPPAITGPKNLTAYVGANCMAIVQMDTAKATDCDPNVRITNNQNSTGAVYKDTFTVGNYNVTFTATDKCNNTSTRTFSIVVRDSTPPTIICRDTTITCGRPIPTLVPVAADNCGVDSIRLISETRTLSSCGTGQIQRIYRAYDKSLNTRTCTQLITINPSNAFTAARIRWATTPFVVTTCIQPGQLNAPVTTVDTAGLPCVKVVVSSRDSIGESNQYCYIIFRKWTVIDSCNFNPLTGAGKWDSTQVIAIDDNAPPVLTGPANITVKADANACGATINLDSVKATDCDPKVVITNNKGGGPKFTGFIPVGVDSITFTATDSCGNSSIFRVRITVRDSTPPVLTCPANVNIRCDSIYKVVFPTATDNCGVTALVYDSTRVSGPCGKDTITYRFTARDAANNQATCSYKVIFSISPPLPCNLITLARDTIVLESCTRSTHPDSITNSRPTIPNLGRCFGLKVTYKDTTLSTPTTGQCNLVIRRTWTISDTCASPAAICIKNQVILVEDRDAPELRIPANICAFAKSTDTGYTILTIPVATVRDCDPAVVVTNSYNNGGANLSDTFFLGQTLVIFTATDACGNVAKDTMLVEVKDSFPPSFACQKLFRHVTNDPVPKVTVKPEEFVSNIKDNFSSPNDIWFSFSPNVNDTLKTYGCDSIGVLSLRVYGTDNSGNQSFCNTLIRVLDTLLFCPSPIALGVTVGGNVTSYNGADVQQASIMAMGIEVAEQKTNANGFYYFNGLPKGDNLTIKPHKYDGLLDGVNALDLVILKKHILGLEAFVSPYQHIAGDVNLSGNLSTLDLVQLQKMLLGVQTLDKNYPSWRFIDQGFVFDPLVDPLTQNFPEAHTFQNLNGDAMQTNFTAIKLGDVNGSAGINIQSAELRQAPVYLHAENNQIPRGEQITIPLVMDDNRAAQGFQFGLWFDESALEVIAVEPGAHTQGLDYAIHEGQLSLVWYDAYATRFERGETVVQLVVRAKQAVKLHEALKLSDTYYHAWFEDGHAQDLKLTVGTPVDLADYILYQNRPNPFLQESTISFYVPNNAQVKLSLFDVTGKRLHTLEGNYSKGLHAVNIDLSTVQYHGVLYYRMEANDFTATKKMIRVR